jgi:hypothetical protein
VVVIVIEEIFGIVCHLDEELLEQEQAIMPLEDIYGK